MICDVDGDVDGDGDAHDADCCSVTVGAVSVGPLLPCSQHCTSDARRALMIS